MKTLCNSTNLGIPVKYRLLLILILCIGIVSHIYGQDSGSMKEAWKLITEEKLFSVYGRKLHDSKFKEIKITGRIESTISAIVRALEDIAYQKEWVLRTKDAYEIEQLGIGKYYYYLSTDMPFPVQDRDLIVYYERIQDPISKTVTTHAIAAPDRLAEEKGIIRIPSFESHYILVPKERGWLEMEYFLKIDPGGSLPAWVVNLAASAGPKSTMRSLYKIIESGKYDDVVVEGVVEP